MFARKVEHVFVDTGVLIFRLMLLKLEKPLQGNCVGMETVFNAVARFSSMLNELMSRIHFLIEGKNHIQGLFYM